MVEDWSLNGNPNDPVKYRASAESKASDASDETSGPLDKELGKDKVMDPLGDYQLEMEETITNLIKLNPGLSRSEPVDVEMEEIESNQSFQSEAWAQPFRPNITEPGYQPILAGSQEAPSLPVTPQEDQLLDRLESLVTHQSHALGAGKP